jgi:hypothetical protein
LIRKNPFYTLEFEIIAGKRILKALISVKPKVFAPLESSGYSSLSCGGSEIKKGV